MVADCIVVSVVFIAGVTCHGVVTAEMLEYRNNDSQSVNN